MAKSNKPKKPTQSYGYLSFSKDGKVSKNMFSLSNDKDTQEYRVAEQFCEHLIHSGQLSADAEIVKLPEADHDFIIKNIPNSLKTVNLPKSFVFVTCGPAHISLVIMASCEQIV